VPIAGLSINPAGPCWIPSLAVSVTAPTPSRRWACVRPGAA